MHDSERVPAPPGSLVRPGEDWASLPSTTNLDWVPADARARRRSSRLWVHLTLFLATVLTTTSCGVEQYLSFSAGFGGHAPAVTASAILAGFWYSGTVLAILGCHEMGHYITCRLYGIDATLPFFLPAPIVMTGTFGAVIRIRDMFPDRRSLFDVGIAGPIAGFVVAVPALILGLWLSRVEPVPSHWTGGYWLGEPLLFKAAAWLIWGRLADGVTLNLHPMGFAAWFGLIMTALNLIPIGQLDGGHIAYAVLGRRSVWVTTGSAVAGALIVAVYRSVTLGFFFVLAVSMLFIAGLRHPATLDDVVDLGWGRMALTALAIVILVLCFTPDPIEVLLPH